MLPLTKENALHAAKLYHTAREGRGLERSRAQVAIAESISQGDFPTLIAPLVRRTLLAYYQEQASVVDQWTTRITVNSIGVDEQYNSYRFAQDNIPASSMGNPFIKDTLPSVANRESYPQLNFAASGKTLRADQFGEAFAVDWQSIVNSRGTNINLIDDAVKFFALHARNLEDALPVGQLINAAGVNPALLTNGGQQLAGNPDLTNILNIQQAVRLAQTTFIDGVQQTFDKFALLTAPNNVSLAKQALTSTLITQIPARTGTPSATTGSQYSQNIDLGATIDVVPQRWFSSYNPTFAATGWVLVPVGAARPVITANYLAGYETPSFFVKDANQRLYGGGESPVLDGDFDSDGIATKVRHVFGSNTMWAQGTVISTGANA